VIFLVLLVNRPQAGKPADRGLLLDGLDRDGQRHFVANIRYVFSHAEIRTFDLGGSGGAAGIFLQHRMRHAQEGIDGERDRLGDVLDRQVAFHRD
jgi:hypothetical protein